MTGYVPNCVRNDRVDRKFGRARRANFIWSTLHGISNLPDAIVREAYLQEVSSAGFWPGSRPIYPGFYSYAYPAPPRFSSACVRPAAAFFCPELKEFILLYETVRTADAPDVVLLAFLQSTYEAAANAAKWDRAALACALGVPNVPRPVS